MPFNPGKLGLRKKVVNVTNAFSDFKMSVPFFCLHSFAFNLKFFFLNLKSYIILFYICPFDLVTCLFTTLLSLSQNAGIFLGEKSCKLLETKLVLKQNEFC